MKIAFLKQKYDYYSSLCYEVKTETSYLQNKVNDLKEEEKILKSQDEILRKKISEETELLSLLGDKMKELTTFVNH